MNILIDEYLNALAYDRGIAPNTRLAYAADLRDMAAFMARRDIDSPNDIERSDVLDYLSRLRRRKLAGATMARRLIALRGFLTYLQSEGLLDRNVTEVMRQPGLWQSLPHVLGEEDVNRLLDIVAGDSTLAVRDRAVLELFYACGLRVSELAGLRLQDLRLDEGFLRCMGKGARQRVVPVGAQAERWMQRYLSEARPKLAARNPAEATVFLSRLGRPFARETLWRLVKRHAREAGVDPDASPHTLRHSFASHLLAHGAQLRLIQEMLGHADIATTQIYTHVDRDRLAAVHRQFHPRS